MCRGHTRAPEARRLRRRRHRVRWGLARGLPSQATRGSEGTSWAPPVGSLAANAFFAYYGPQNTSHRKRNFLFSVKFSSMNYWSSINFCRCPVLGATAGTALWLRHWIPRTVSNFKAHFLAYATQRRATLWATLRRSASEYMQNWLLFSVFATRNRPNKTAVTCG